MLDKKKIHRTNHTHAFAGLGVTCGEAPFWVRPGLRTDLWGSNYVHISPHAMQAVHPVSVSAHQLAPPRITRSTLGRLVSTSFKLHNLEKRHAKPQAMAQHLWTASWQLSRKSCVALPCGPPPNWQSWLHFIPIQCAWYCFNVSVFALTMSLYVCELWPSFKHCVIKLKPVKI